MNFNVKFQEKQYYKNRSLYKIKEKWKMQIVNLTQNLTPPKVHSESEMQAIVVKFLKILKIKVLIL